MKLSTIHLLPTYYEYVIITMLRKASGHVTIPNAVVTWRYIMRWSRDYT